MSYVVSAAAEALLPTAIAALEGYVGGAFAAAALSGVVNGYNGNYSSGNFSGGLGVCENASMARSCLIPPKVTTRSVSRIAQSEIAGNLASKAASKLTNAFSWVTRGSARQAAAKTAATTAAKTTQVAARNGVAKASNQAVAKNLLSEEGMGSATKFVNPFKLPATKDVWLLI